MTSANRPIGLYQDLINLAVDKELRQSVEGLQIDRELLHPEEAPDRLALYFGKILSQLVLSFPEGQRLEASRELINRLLESAAGFGKVADLSDKQFGSAIELLSGIYLLRQDGTPDRPEPPLTPLLDTVLVTNARNEPNIAAQIKAEIASADQIDIVMAFVRKSGIRKFLSAFERFMARDTAPKIRLLTTTYTQSTELGALKVLQDLGAEIRVSYDEGMTRLHAKAWYFHRNSGASTAFIGSSNLTHSAQETGMEWNIRVSALRNPDITRKVSSVFDAYWESDDFIDFDEMEFAQRIKRSKSESTGPSVAAYLDVTLKPFQARLLEQVSLAREKGQHRNLLVSATGTGKTVMAAVDYRQLRNSLHRSRLLFIAHRKEILTQSRDTFRMVLKDWSFGELWVDGERPDRFDHVFASIQSLNSVDLNRLNLDHYDVVIVDEFHHAAASSYQRLLSYLRPKQMLALTATPERADGHSVLELFDGRISAEYRLWDAIDQKSLVPFEYFGIADGTDLTQVSWRKGQGYDLNELSNVYTANDGVVKRVLAELNRRISDWSAVSGLGFCVTVTHAHFMAEQFSRAGIVSVAVSGNTPREERQAALKDLAKGSLRFIFSVDVFNEGVDLPKVNTLLLLRPTQSSTVFIQQLGRGLRRDEGKNLCTVFDFMGQHRREFRFDLRYRSLLGGSRKELEQQVKDQFPYLPSGCYMELDAVSQDAVLKSLKNALPNGRTAMKKELMALVSQVSDPQLTQFLEHTGLSIEDVYVGSGDNSWSGLREESGLPVKAKGPFEPILRRAIGRLLHIDDLERLQAYQKWVSDETPPRVDGLSAREKRLLHMLLAVLCDQVKADFVSLQMAADLVWQHAQVLSELSEVFAVCNDRVSHRGSTYEPLGVNPLCVHARYSRIEILAAFGEGEQFKTPTWREGVRWSEPSKTDILAFTLNKTPGKFSPTTMYKDYAINQELIHWESQSLTSDYSPTGIRYRTHQASGSKVALFARETSDQRAFWFLGTANYVSHEGSRPMSIVWKLDNRLPGDLFSSFVAAVA